MKTQINLNNKKILITGGAGFIGAFLVQRLLHELEGAYIVALDNVNDYYDVNIKKYRLEENDKASCSGKSGYIFVKGNIADKDLIDKLFEQYQPDIVVNLAAQAGVRYSIENGSVNNSV